MKLVTNRPDFFNDISEEMRLFLGDAPIELVPEALASKAEEDADTLFVTLLSEDGVPHATARMGGLSAESAASGRPTGVLEQKRVEKRMAKLAAYRLFKRLYPEVATPWGSLTGIRPTKLFRELTLRGQDAEESFARLFDVSPEKLALTRDICAVQRPFLSSVKPAALDVYIGIPYCASRCLYCSFGSEVARDPAAVEAYLTALYEDISAGARLFTKKGFSLRNLYMGGGTPTILSAGQLDKLLSHVKSCYGSLGGECTVEAGRPDTITAEKLAVLAGHRVCRVSINPQTMRDETLARVGRKHTAADIADAYALARAAGDFIINMDVIAGLPGERLADGQHTLDALSALRPDNLTVHTLAVKRASLLRRELEKHPMPEQEEASAMVRAGLDAARGLGMRPYYMYRQKYMRGNLENVGYALPGTECAYNIDMMEESVSILAHGANAMTKRVYQSGGRIERLPAPKDVPTYIGKLPQLLFDKERLFSD